MPASVTINGCSLKKWISAPIAAPNNAPNSSTSGTIAQIGQCHHCAATAHRMVVSATTEPTDRSMPPDTITNVMPSATISRNELSTSRPSSTCSEKKPVYITEPKPNSAANKAIVTTIG